MSTHPPIVIWNGDVWFPPGRNRSPRPKTPHSSSRGQATSNYLSIMILGEVRDERCLDATVYFIISIDLASCFFSLLFAVSRHEKTKNSAAKSISYRPIHVNIGNVFVAKIINEEGNQNRYGRSPKTSFCVYMKQKRTRAIGASQILHVAIRFNCPRKTILYGDCLSIQDFTVCRSVDDTTVVIDFQLKRYINSENAKVLNEMQWCNQSIVQRFVTLMPTFVRQAPPVQIWMRI